MTKETQSHSILTDASRTVWLCESQKSTDEKNKLESNIPIQTSHPI